MPDLAQSFTILTLLYVLIAVFWLLCALAAFANYRGFKRPTDLGWLGAFLLLSLARGVDAYASSAWSDVVVGGAGGLVGPLEFAAEQGLRAAVFELVAAIIVFYVFRQRRVQF